MSPVVLTAIAATVGYVAIPLIGAAAVRHAWRAFRARVTAAAALPDVEEVDSGACRVVGRVNAVQGDDTLWVGTERGQVAVHLGSMPIHLVRTIPPGARRPDPVPPRVTRWRNLAAIAEGTSILVLGSVTLRSRVRHVDPTGVPQRLVVIYDGPSEDLIATALWMGRSRSEYWNSVTPLSLAITVIFLAWLAVASFSETRFGALVALVGALLPVTPIVPPAVVATYVYRRLWRRGRRLGAIRDVLRMPDRLNGTGHGVVLDPFGAQVGDRGGTSLIDVTDVPGRPGAPVMWIPRAPNPLLAQFTLPDNRTTLARAAERGKRLRELLAVALVITGMAVTAYAAAVLLALTLFGVP